MTIQHVLRQVAGVILEADRWIRIHFFGFSALWPLLGAASVRSHLEWATMAGLLGVAACFHVFGILLNDAVDLPVDRGQPSRAQDPLVRGALRPWHAVMLALVMVPCGFGVATMIDTGATARWVLAGGFVGMAIYDIWGKRCVAPPLTDAIQGAAWAALAFWAALAVTGNVGPLTLVVGAYAVGYLLLINGVHGGLRDLRGDLRAGRRTTAIALGVRPDRKGRPHITRAAWIYCLTVQATLVALTVVPFAPTLRASAGIGRVVAGAAVVLLGASNLALMVMVLRPTRPAWHAAFRLHLVTLLVGMIAALMPHLSSRVNVVLTVVFLTPLLVMQWTLLVLEWMLTMGRSVPHVAVSERVSMNGR